MIVAGHYMTAEYIKNWLVAAESARRNGNPRFDLATEDMVAVLQLAAEAAPSQPFPLPALERPLVVFDLETTGAEAATDRIVQLAGIVIEPDGHEREFNWLVNPGCPIPPGATAVHHVTDAMVAEAPTFRQLVATTDVWEIFQGCDLGGFNQTNFDVPLLWEEFRRAGKFWDLAGVKQVDVGVLFKLQERRRLSDAVAKYAGPDAAATFAGQAHDALADIRATLDVLRRMRARHPALLVSLAELDRLSVEQEQDGRTVRRVDLAGVLVRDAEGVVRFTHKKVRGVALRDDRGYAEWILRSDFSENTKQAVRDELRRIEEERRASLEDGAEL